MKEQRRKFIKYSSTVLVTTVSVGCLGGESEPPQENATDGNETQQVSEPANIVFHGIDAPSSIEEEEFSFSVNLENKGDEEGEVSFIVNDNVVETQTISSGSLTHNITVSNDLVTRPNITIGARSENDNISSTITVNRTTVIEISNVKDIIERNGFERLRIEGIATNLSDRRIEYIEIRLTLYDDRDRAITTYRKVFRAGETGGVLAPGEEWPFQIPITESPGTVDDYSLEVLNYRFRNS